MAKNIHRNIFKLFIFQITQRRAFMPVLAIFFLTLPNSTAQQIGLYSAIGFFASFLLEIPSGYFADNFGHRRTLILAKICMILSTLLFIIADGLYFFILGSLFLSVSFALGSGTQEAIVHNTLTDDKKEKSYTKVMSKLSANVSIISGIMMILLPFLTKIHVILPIAVYLLVDGIGLIAAVSLIKPRTEHEVSFAKPEKIGTLLKQQLKTGFYPMAIFLGAVAGFVVSGSVFREVYLKDLGFWIPMIGAVMGLSRFVWFGVGHLAHKIEEKVNIKLLLISDIIFFPACFVLIAFLSDPYAVAAIFIVSIGYLWGRNHILTHYFISNFTRNPKYKATLLSIKSQISYIFQAVSGFGIGYAMNYSYKLENKDIVRIS